jgi:YD repeat-containing protein
VERGATAPLSGSTRFEYDALGRVVEKTQITGSGGTAQTQVVQYA